MQLFELFGTIMVDNKKANESIHKTESLASKLSDKFQDFGGKVSKVGSSLTKSITAPLTALGLAGVKMGLDVESGIKKVTTLADKEILPESKIRAEVKAISNATGIAQTEISEAIYSALSAGVESEKVLEFVRSGVDLTRAGFTSMETAIDATTTVLNAYGDDAYDVSKIHDIFVQTQDKGKISVDELGSSIGRVIPTASSLGVNVDQLGASYAILTAKGQNAQLATTNLNAMLGEMGKTGSTSDGILRELTGKSFKELIDEGKNVGEVLGLLDQYAKDNNLSMKDLFGSMNAGSAAVTLLSDGVEGYNEMLDEMNNSTGKTAENAKIMEDGWFKIRQALNNMKNALMDVVESALPYIEMLAEKVSSLADWFINLDDKTKQTIFRVGAFAVALGPLLSVFGGVISMSGKLIGSFSKIASVGSSLASGLASTVGFIFSPAGAIIAGIAAIIGIGIALWKNWETLEEKASWLTDGLTEAFEFAKEVITTIINDYLIPAFKSVVDWVRDNWGTIEQVIRDVFNAVTAVLSAFVAVFKLIWDKFGDHILNYISIVFERTKGIIQSVMTIIQGIIKTITAIIAGDWKGAWEGIKKIAEGVWNAIKTVINTQLEFLKLIIKVAWDFIKGITSSIWNGIKSVITGVWESIKSAVSSAVNSVQSTVSNVFNALKNTVSGIWNGIKDAIMTPMNAAKNGVAAVINGMKSLFNFKWKWPRIPLPHFSFTGSINPFSGNFPPKVSVAWYAKGGYMDKATIFGGAGNTLFGGGEAGGEGIVPLQGRHMYPLADAMADRLNSIDNMSEKRLDEIVRLMSIMVDMMKSTDIQWNDRELGRLVRKFV